MNAFEPEGEPWNTAAVKETLKEKIPSHVQKKVEENAQIRELHNELPKHKDGGLDHGLVHKIRELDNELPKDKDGGLVHGLVHNALHRFFVQQHG